jgi:glycosyltransferase involved in cell wall biosynthesis
MRILQIICTLGTGGAEKLLLDTVVLYRKAGIEMDVLVLWDNDFQFTKALEELNCCKIFILKKSERFNDIYNPLAIFKIKKILKDYDIAHVHLFPPQYFVLFANMLNGDKTKLVFTEHSTSNTRIANRIFKVIEKFVYSKYDKVICITEEIEKKYQRYLGLNDKWIVINNGIDLQKIREALSYEKSDLGYDEDVKLLIMVAGFRIGKDQDTVIRALLLLPSSFKLLLVGDGIRKEELTKLVEDLNLVDRVNFLGQRMDVPRLLKSSDFIILSSQYEGLSLSSVEGMASGKPFIASNVPGLTDLVKNAGILFEDGNSEQLAEIIISLSNNQEEYQHVVSQCIERAQEYDISIMINRHIELYRSLILQPDKTENNKVN